MTAEFGLKKAFIFSLVFHLIFLWLSTQGILFPRRKVYWLTTVELFKLSSPAKKEKTDTIPLKKEKARPEKNIEKKEEPQKAGPVFTSPVTIETLNFPFPYYLFSIRDKISANWKKPAVLPRKKAVVYFRILRNGQVKTLKIEESSQENFFDQAVLRAVANALPFPPLPEGYEEDTLDVHIGFSWQ